MRVPLRGKNMMLFLDGKTLALATSCSLDIVGDTEETSSKDNGSWKEFIMTMLSFSGSSDTLVSVVDNDNTVDLAMKELYAKLIAMESIPFVLGEITSRTNANNDMPEAGWAIPTTDGYSGSILITGISPAAPVDGKATMSISFQGTGPLTAQTASI